MNSAWYIEFGSMIVTTMFIEIPIPHFFPSFIVFVKRMMAWYDRRFTSNKSVSRQFKQSDYEDVYIGPEFLIDARLA